MGKRMADRPDPAFRHDRAQLRPRQGRPREPIGVDFQEAYAPHHAGAAGTGLLRSGSSGRRRGRCCPSPAATAPSISSPPDTLAPGNGMRSPHAIVGQSRSRLRSAFSAPEQGERSPATIQRCSWFPFTGHRVSAAPSIRSIGVFVKSALEKVRLPAASGGRAHEWTAGALGVQDPFRWPVSPIVAWGLPSGPLIDSCGE